MSEWKNKLYYGDNLTWLRDHDAFPNESIDLIYLDPPFNSKADYNVIFTEPGGEKKSQAQIQAFDDSWHWEKEAAVNAISELAASRPDIVELIEWLGHRGDKKSTSTAAYLSMMLPWRKSIFLRPSDWIAFRPLAIGRTARSIPTNSLSARS